LHMGLGSIKFYGYPVRNTYGNSWVVRVAMDLGLCHTIWDELMRSPSTVFCCLYMCREDEEPLLPIVWFCDPFVFNGYSS
jgi:hypothetical protein